MELLPNSVGSNVRLVQLRLRVELLRREVATIVRPDMRPLLNEMIERGEAAIVDCESALARRTPPA